VKTYDIENALDVAVKVGSEKVWVLANGLIKTGLIRSYGLTERLIISTYGVTREGRNKINIRGKGELIIGSPDFLDQDSCSLALELRKGGAEAYCTGLVMLYQLSKLAVNAVINSITSILDAPNRVVFESLWARRIAWRVVGEIVSFAEKLGVWLDRDRVYEWTMRVAEETGDNISSMLQDLRACRNSEIESILGEPLRLSRELGVRLDYIELLYMLVKALEDGGLRCRREKR
jgi:2-dehydropantoate 2-reductase